MKFVSQQVTVKQHLSTWLPRHGLAVAWDLGGFSVWGHHSRRSRFDEGDGLFIEGLQGLAA